MNSIHPSTFSNFYHPDHSGQSAHFPVGNNGTENCQWITNGNECGRKFINAIAVGNHIEIEHLSHNAKSCFWGGCGEKFETKFDLKVHIRSHTNVMAFICGICKKCFEHVENLHVHMVTHEDQLSFDCTHPGCGRSFNSQSNRLQHMHVHSTHTKYFCDDNKELDTGKLTSANKTVSVRVSNGTAPPVLKKQDMSMREFIKWSDAQLVPSYLTGFPSTPYNYSSFPHVSNSPDDMDSQVPISSIPQYKVTHQPLRCLWTTDGQQCQKIFANSEDLGSHVREEHAKGRQICQWDNCGKEFDWKYKLVNHLPVHTGEKAFRCDTCGNQFGQKQNLKIHQRTHTGEKPFLCTHDGCNKRFKDSSDLKHHLYCHSEKKNHICKHSGCGKRYSHHKSLRTHERNNHKDQTFKQAVTGSIGPGKNFEELQNHLLDKGYITN